MRQPTSDSTHENHAIVVTKTHAHRARQPATIRTHRAGAAYFIAIVVRLTGGYSD